MPKTLWKRIRLSLTIASTVLVLASSSNAADVPANQKERLSETEISAQLKTVFGWRTDGKQISRTFQFKDFVEAISFVNRLVEPAQRAGHHPDIMIVYNQVTLSLTTHDVGGLTKQDFALARIISQLRDNR